MTQHYTVSANIPGYLPEGDDVFCYDGPESALMAWNNNLTRVLDDIEGDAEFLLADIERNMVTVSDVESNEGASLMVGNVRHYIEVCGECGDTGEDCIGECADECPDDNENGCEGHESLDGAHMGETVYCDGSCRHHHKKEAVS